MTEDKKKKRRSKANGEGTIYKDGKRYRGQFVIGKKADGSYIRKSFYGKTKLDVTKQRDEYMASVQNGTYVEPDKITFGEWAVQWLETYKKDHVSPKYYDSIEYHLKLHLIPSLGHIRLQDLTTDMIQNMYDQKYHSGNLKEGSGLSPRTIKHFHETLRMILNKAVSRNLINKNPALDCDLKYPEREAKKKYLIIEESKKIIDAINPNVRSQLFVLTTLNTGLRKGETIALTWEDVDLENSIIHVNHSITVYRNRDNDTTNRYIVTLKEPKTVKSKRSVPITNELTGLLKKHKQNMIEENLKAGRSNKDYNFVFQTRNGTPHRQSNITRTWKKLLEKANVEYIKFHSTRHSYATRLAEKNLHPKVTQAVMGHSRISTTLDIYSHVSKEMIDATRSTISEVFKNDDDLPATIKNTSDSDLVEENSTEYIAV